MREIKFRGKDLRGQWQYGDLIHNDETDLLIRQGCINSFIENETIGQFTGLKDKNGKEIYEGDIYQSNKGGINEVCWIIGDGCGFTGFDFAPFYHIEGVISDIEIIGNIHDNPELLEGGAE